MKISKIITADHNFFVKLAVLNVENNLWGRGDIDNRINERAVLKNRIDAVSVDGKIWVSQSGMDCDCVMYQDDAYEIDATVKAYWNEHDRIAEWADGRFSLNIHDAKYLPNKHSRDLALEAFEDGHPYYIYD